ncbi:zinc finger domain-containing protein [Streptomyces parvus]|uniref:zinc finger domain-containing protein n=1 Tax=Streptomyces parvus TaxID=66428 RepID=UPI00332905BF
MQAHRTLRRFLAALYWDRSVRAAAGRPGAWLNSYPPKTPAGSGYVRIAGMDLDRPVTVHLARGRGRNPRFWALPFDLDAKHHAPGQVADDAALLSDAVRAEGIGPVPVASGSPGGMHLWTGCRAGVPFPLVQRIYRAAARLCPSLDASLSNPTDALLRPPGSAHRNGGYATLTAHTVDEAVNVLGPESAPVTAFYRLAARLETMAADLPPEQAEPAAPATAAATASETGHGRRTVPPSILARGPRVRRIVQDATGCPVLDTPWRPLGGRALRGLHRRPTRRDDHSAIKHAPARSMALAGWTQAEGLAVVRDPQSSPALEYLRSERQADGSRRPRREEETARLWARVWWLAVEDAARMPRRPQDHGHAPQGDEVQQAVADLFARMRAAGPRRWARKSGPADEAILRALALLMMLAGTVDVSANVHRVGLLAGYTGQTASLALWRLTRDGWITVTAEAERRAGKARRVTLATSHECPDDEHHRCAVYQAPENIAPDHTGSDRSRTPRPPAPPTCALSASPDALRGLLTHQQADVWHDIGHHAARTLWAVQQAGNVTVAQIMGETGYGRRTTLRHLHRLAGLQLVEPARRRRGGTTYRATGRALYEAGRESGSAGRMAAMAVVYRVKQETIQWWAAEEVYRSLPYAQRPRRAPADQAVIPGMDPRGRAYPRDEQGHPDHARARRIEAQRINAAGMLDHAQELTRTGQLLDLPYLTPPEPSRPHAGVRAGRRAVIPTRHRCPYCHAEPGARCTTGSSAKPAFRWHAARRRAARQAAEHGHP